MKRIGIVGCGTIGRFLAKRIEKEFKESAKVVGLCDIDKKKAEELARTLSGRVNIFTLKDLIDKADLIIEAASGSISANICRKALSKSKDIMVMSIGGILKDSKRLFALASRKGAKIILPSGAICGLDGLKSAGASRIDSVTLTTRKPPRGLKGAPYIVKKKIDLDSIKNERLIFKGTAHEAVSAFPKNINVSALLSIAGIGAKKTKVCIITSPKYKRNVHEVEAKGDFGRLSTRTENLPFSENPKTSFLAALSAIATLKELLNPNFKIGT